MHPSITITLPNGLTITGTEEQIIKCAITLGFHNPLDDLFYNSESKGFLLIKEMETNHLRNSISKMIRNDVNWRDITFQAMVKEYLRRTL